MKTNVLRVANGALRYRPSADIFADLRQRVPPEWRRDADRRGSEAMEPAGGAVRQASLVSGPADQRDAFDRRPFQQAEGLAAMAESKPGATTIDHLFGALPPTVTPGRAWLYTGGELRPVALRLGISDGTWTELLNTEISEGQALVSNIVTPAMAAAAKRPGTQQGPGQSGRSTNPFQAGGGGGHGAPH